jgi:uncharacterized protein
MLIVDIPRIPPDGLELDEALDAAKLHLEGESEFEIAPGATFKGRVELVDGTTVHVRGRLAGAIRLECGRCLERYALPVDQDLDLFYLPRAADRPQEQEEEVELSDRDVVVGYYDGDELDLGEVVREQIFLGLPLKRLCREDCRGRCATCGQNLNQQTCSCPPADEGTDPRLAPLKKLLES